MRLPNIEPDYLKPASHSGKVCDYCRLYSTVNRYYYYQHYVVCEECVLIEETREW